MAGLLVPPYGAMESVSNADSKLSLIIFRLWLSNRIISVSLKFAVSRIYHISA